MWKGLLEGVVLETEFHPDACRNIEGWKGLLEGVVLETLPDQLRELIHPGVWKGLLEGVVLETRASRRRSLRSSGGRACSRA